ncbi:MAG TPA: ribulokinase, partial [Candidatus Hydrogenedentes bacterium]|nr:ribulokinase [Candidatus Hydrogenedentota bacterium]
GAAMAGAVVAGPAAGGHADFEAAADAMVRVDDRVYTPIPENAAVYDRLFGLYRRLHDSFGVRGHQDSLYDVMKELLALRDEARA